jgi:NADH dehydrogenase
MGMTVLVVGGTGMLGEPVARRLVARGHRARVLSRAPERVAERLGGVCELVRGDVDDRESLSRALDGCDGVHMSLNGAGDWDLERRGAEAVAALAANAGVQRISLISGASTCEDNAWFPMTRAKLDAERAVSQCGVPFSIFRCTMFMELLPKFVRGGKAMIMGRQPHAWRWTAAMDYAAMVARAYELPEAANKVFHVRGPQALTMAEALEVYRRVRAPQVKVVTVPFWVLRIVASLPGGRQLRREALPLMRYFSKVPEAGDPTEANDMLGAPSTTLEAWCRQRGA